MECEIISGDGDVVVATVMPDLRVLTVHRKAVRSFDLESDPAIIVAHVRRESECTNTLHLPVEARDTTSVLFSSTRPADSVVDADDARRVQGDVTVLQRTPHVTIVQRDVASVG